MESNGPRYSKIAFAGTRTESPDGGTGVSVGVVTRGIEGTRESGPRVARRRTARFWQSLLLGCVRAAAAWLAHALALLGEWRLCNFRASDQSLRTRPMVQATLSPKGQESERLDHCEIASFRQSKIWEPRRSGYHWRYQDGLRHSRTFSVTKIVRNPQYSVPAPHLPNRPD